MTWKHGDTTFIADEGRAGDVKIVTDRFDEVTIPFRDLAGFAIGREVERLRAEVGRLELANAEFAGCLEAIERSLRGGMAFVPRGETWKAVRDLLDRHG